MAPGKSIMGYESLSVLSFLESNLPMLQAKLNNGKSFISLCVSDSIGFCK